MHYTKCGVNSSLLT